MKSGMLTASVFLLACAGATSLAIAKPIVGPVTRAATHRSQSIESVPAALRPVLLESLANDAGAAYRIDEHGCAALSTQALKGCFDSRGAHFSGPGATSLALHLDTIGRGSDKTSLSDVSPIITANRASYMHDTITEWWRALPVGFEQGFTVAKRPGGHGDLTLALAASGDASLHGGTLAWDKFRYGGLVVTDANGKTVPSTLKSESNRVVLAVDDAHAEYPLSIDPLLWTEQKVTANDGAALQLFGYAVAMDSAGTTALISGPFFNDVDPTQQNPVPAPPGAVYVFTNVGGVWAQTQKIQPSDSSPGDNFGFALAISGTTAAISSLPEDAYANFPGGNAVYVFTSSGGTWTQQQKLTASDNPPGSAWFGAVVAVDGSTIVVGAAGTNIDANVGAGAAYIFSLQNGTWAQTQELTMPGAVTYDGFGYAVGVHNNVVVVGSLETVAGLRQGGAAYVYAPSAGTWEQVQKLTAPDVSANSTFGSAFALDDTTMLVGANYQKVNGTNCGAVYVFTQAGGVWTETQELSPSDGQQFSFFGIAVALSNGRALIGARQSNAIGKAYLFTSNAGVWSQTQELTASDGGSNNEFGASVALSGNTALVGAVITGAAWNGAAYFYTQQPLTPPAASATPASLAFVLSPGGSGSSALTLADTGESDLTWAIAEAAASTRPGSAAVTGHSGTAQWTPFESDSSLSFVLDNGGYQDSFGFTTPSMYLNRFSPPAGTGAFTIDSISVMWPQNANGTTLIGQQANLTAYYDADSDGDPANAVRLGGDQVVTIASIDNFIRYTMNFFVPGDGDIYIGVEFSPVGVSPFPHPMAVEEGNPTDGENSWLINNAGNAVDLNNLGNNQIHLNMKSVAYTKTFLIRATGLSGPCSSPADVPWLSETPVNGSVPGGGSQEVTVTADATGLAAGAYSATLCVATNDPANGLLQVPVSLTVLAPGDRVFAAGFEGL